MPAKISEYRHTCESGDWYLSVEYFVNYFNFLIQKRNYFQMLYLPLIAAAISAFGQVFLKYAMLKHGPIQFNLSGLINFFFEPYLLIGLGIYVAALIMWLHVLSKVPLSTAYPMLAITYAIVPLLSVVFFGERIQQPQIIGICLVLVGVAMIGKTA